MMAQSIHSIVANKGQGATIDDVLREVRCAYLRLTAASGSEREEEATSTQREVIHLPSDGVYSRCAVAGVSCTQPLILSFLCPSQDGAELGQQVQGDVLLPSSGCAREQVCAWDDDPPPSLARSIAALDRADSPAAPEARHPNHAARPQWENGQLERGSMEVDMEEDGAGASEEGQGAASMVEEARILNNMEGVLSMDG